MNWDISIFALRINQPYADVCKFGVDSIYISVYTYMCLCVRMRPSNNPPFVLSGISLSSQPEQL